MQRQSQVEPVVYFVSRSGELMLAPDTRMKPFRGWMRVECNTVNDIEIFSRKMAAQQYTKFRSMKVEEHLRSQRKRNEIKTNCKLRLAAGCISAEDERLTRQTIQSLDRKDSMFIHMLSTEPDLSRGSLVIEQKEQPIGMAQYNNKRKGLADNEINAISQLAESTA